MNRIYTITVGALEIKGLISPGELPNLKSDFNWLVSYYEATMEVHENTLIARKKDVEICLTIGEYHSAIPGKRVLQVLVHLMDEMF